MKKYLVRIEYKTEVYAEDSKLAVNQAVGRITGHRLITGLIAEVIPSNKENNREED